MNTVVKIKELSVDHNGDVTLEGVEIDLSEQTLMGLVAAFAKKAILVEEAPIAPSAPKAGEAEPAPNKEDKPLTNVAACPECEANIPLVDGTIESEIMQCTDCGAELEVESVTPPVLVATPEESEDWGE